MLPQAFFATASRHGACSSRGHAQKRLKIRFFISFLA
jgi:hypothetical protein